MRPAGELGPLGAERRLSARQVTEELEPRADEPARHQRRLDRRGAGQHRHLHAGLEGGRDQPRARIVHPWKPRVRDERDPLAAREPRQQLCRPLRLVVPVIAAQPCRDPVPLEETLRVPRVLAEDEVGLGELAEARRVTSSRFPIGVAQTASGTQLLRARRRRAGPLRPPRHRSRARLGRSAARPAPARALRASRLRAPPGRETLPPPARSRRRPPRARGTKMFTSEPIPAPSRCPIPLSASSASGSPSSARPTNSSAVAPSPHSRSAARSAALPEATASRCPRPVQVPWQGGPSATTTTCPSSAQPRKSCAVENEAAADARTERQHDEVRRAPPCAEPPFGERGRRSRRSRPPPGTPKRSPMPSGSDTSCERDVDRAQRPAGLAVEHGRNPEPERRERRRPEPLDRLRDRFEQLLLRVRRRRHLAPLLDRPVPVEHAGQDLRAAEIDADDALLTLHGPRLPYPAGWRTERSPTGSTRAAVPEEGSRSHPVRRRSRRPERAGRRRQPRRRRRWGRGSASRWACSSCCSSSGPRSATSRSATASKPANDAAARAVRASLAQQDGAVISKPSLILLLGTDGDRTAAREDARRSDSILIVRTDPKRHRLAYLSIPRDLRVDIPGHGPNKINAAFQLGGPVLAMKTVKALTGPAGEPRRPRRLRGLPRGDRRARRDRDQRARSRSSRTASTARTRPTRAARSGTAGASRRASRRWTAGGR